MIVEFDKLKISIIICLKSSHLITIFLGPLFWILDEKKFQEKFSQFRRKKCFFECQPLI